MELERQGGAMALEMETEMIWLGLSGRDMLPKATACPALGRGPAGCCLRGLTLGRAPHDAGALAEPLETKK